MGTDRRTDNQGQVGQGKISSQMDFNVATEACMLGGVVVRLMSWDPA